MLWYGCPVASTRTPPHIRRDAPRLRSLRSHVHVSQQSGSSLFCPYHRTCLLLQHLREVFQDFFHSVYSPSCSQVRRCHQSRVHEMRKVIQNEAATPCSRVSTFGGQTVYLSELWRRFSGSRRTCKACANSPRSTCTVCLPIVRKDRQPS